MTAVTAGSRAIPRFWTARDAELRMDGGYLSDPEGRYATLLGAHPAVALNTLDDVPCVVLLGEPGSGKTTALRDEVARLRAAAVDVGTTDVALHIDLRDYAEIADLRTAVFEHRELVRWKDETHRLTLCLDSLDEALIDMRKLGTRLASELRELPIAQLRVRIACRTGDWPSVLEHELGVLFGEGGLRVLEIAPLRRRDVLEMAVSHLGEDRAREFLDVVAAQDAQPFASKPGTLKFLISSFAATGSLPASQAQLYMIGCRALCEETNESRRAARRTGELSADQRLAVAERAAAATIFGGRAAFWTGIDRDTPTSDLRLADIVGDEPTPVGTIRVNETILRDEVLATGLFSARGPERLGWAHQTYGEFLAARWTVRRNLSPEQVLALLSINDHLGRKLVPQLYETAAWIGSLKPELFFEIMKIEPSVLLQSDVARADPESRERLVAALLDAAERHALPAREFGQILRYRKLQHPGLGEQLRTVIADGTRPDRVRELALEIAIACETREVAEAAAALALDRSATMRLRDLAAWAVAAAHDDSVAAQLLPLALGSEDVDIEDDLKGSALRATWRTIPPAELFASLSRAKRPNVSGAYSVFLQELGDSLSDEYIVPGLEWLERLGHVSSPGESSLEATIILRAFRLLENLGVRERLVRLVRRNLLSYQPLFEHHEERTKLSQVLAEPMVRRHMLTELIQVTVTEAETLARDTKVVEEMPGQASVSAVRRGLNVHTLVEHTYLADEDFIFVLDSLAGVRPSLEPNLSRIAWGDLAEGMLDISRIDHVDAVLERAAAAGVHYTFQHLIEPVDLRGPQAETSRRLVREREAENQKWKARRAASARKTSDKVVQQLVPSAMRLEEAVRTRAELNRPDDLPRLRWIRVFHELVRNDKGEIPSGGHIGDARIGIAWKEAAADVREGVIDAAATFLELGAAPELDLDTGVHFHRYAWAGYVAFRLLAAEAPARLAAYGVETWRRWAPTIALAEPYGETAEERDAHAALATDAYESAPEEVTAAVLGAVDHAIAGGHTRVPERMVSTVAAAALGNAVLFRCTEAIELDLQEATADVTAGLSTSETAGAEPTEIETPQRAHAREMRAGTHVVLLAALLRGGSVEAHTELVEWLEDHTSLSTLDPKSPEAERLFIAARSLLIGAEDAAWRVISEVIEAAPEFAKELFLRTASHREVPIKDFRARLGVRGMGELFVALAKAFPYETDLWHSGVYSPSARDNVTHWRRATLNALEEHGTAEAIDELRRVQAALPHYDWLADSVARAREQQGRLSWRAVSPLDLFALADNRGRRLVRDGGQLLDLVAESLSRYQSELRGENGVNDLWDYSTVTEPCPRDEGHFADHIIRFLKKDLEGRGIAVGCELVVRRGGRGRVAPGLRTDIYVTAVVAAPGQPDRTDGEVASVVIEVKGSWHDEVLTAMRTQLAEGYLTEYAGTRLGIYLVGDFTCDSWTNSDGLRRSRALGGVAALRARLGAQAEELSQAGIRIRAVVLDASLPAL